MTRNRIWLPFAAALSGILCVGRAASAHELGVIQVEATLTPGLAKVEVRVDPEHAPPGFVEEIPRQFRLLFDERPADFRFSRLAGATADKPILVLEADIPSGARTFAFECTSPIGPFPVTLDAVTDWQIGQAPGPRVPLNQAIVPPTTGRVIRDYLALGFTHIVPKGADHILFVLGLFLLSLRWRPLLAQVTSFTLAHTLTLGLSIYGVVSLSPRIVEPLIAVSIVAVAVENLFTQEARASRVALVFGFGLLHGLGFAGVLSELGLPRKQALPALLSFNVGVELGQLTVLALAFLLIGLPFGRRPGYRRWLTIPASIAIATVGLWWAVERLGW
jgi:hypothetical protein